MPLTKTSTKTDPNIAAILGWDADVHSAQDYYAFGMTMPGRNYSAPNKEGYRYGFNGMEKDDDWSGKGNSYDFGARIYDSRLGRWLARDPLEQKYPALSPYCSFGNSPILIIDSNGEAIVIHYKTGFLGLKKRTITLQNWEDVQKLQNHSNEFVQNMYETLNYLKPLSECEHACTDVDVVSKALAREEEVHINESKKDAKRSDVFTSFETS